jgi:5-methylcytosine-specific restriction endonuclease McrA
VNSFYEIATEAQRRRSKNHAALRAERMRAARAIGVHTEAQWLEVLERYDYRCVKCGCTPVGRPCKDHITPIHVGGSDSIENLQPLCRQCNTGKRQDTFNWAAYRDDHGFADVDAPLEQEAF